MAQIIDGLSHIDFEAMREYFMDNGKTVRYLKGDCFSEAERDGRNRLSFIGLANSKNDLNQK